MSDTIAVAHLTSERRHEFIRQTYTHVIAAIGSFSFLSWIFFQSGVGEAFYWAIAPHPWSWLLVLGAFGAFGWITSSLTEAEERDKQYLGLGLASLAEALIFCPLVYAIYENSGFEAIKGAAMGTLALTAAITVVVGTSKHEFSYLKGILQVCSTLALAFIVASIIFGFNLGLLFSYMMLALSGAFMMYDTSRVLNEHTEDNYVVASLEIFSSMALMFWYLLDIFDQAGGDE